MAKIEEMTDKAYLTHWEATKSIPLCGIGKASRFHFNAGFEAGANAIMSIPLSERLNEKEKRSIRYAYIAAKTAMIQGSEISIIVFKSWCELLESIFGKDFFKEESK